MKFLSGAAFGTNYKGYQQTKSFKGPVTVNENENNGVKKN